MRVALIRQMTMRGSASNIMRLLSKFDPKAWSAALAVFSFQVWEVGSRALLSRRAGAPRNLRNNALHEPIIRKVTASDGVGSRTLLCRNKTKLDQIASWALSARTIPPFGKPSSRVRAAARRRSEIFSDSAGGPPLDYMRRRPVNSRFPGILCRLIRQGPSRRRRAQRRLPPSGSLCAMACPPAGRR